MRSNLLSLRSSSSLVLALALGCGDPVVDASDDEAGDAPTGTESGDASDNPEAGSQGNEANEAGDANDNGESGSGSTSEGSEAPATDGIDTTDAPLDTGTETEEAIDCLQLDEPTCEGTDVCVPYMGMPYLMSIDGMICLAPPQFLGCLFAIDACLPATGTLCMGEQAFAVDNLCPPPEGFLECNPPVDGALPCMP